MLTKIRHAATEQSLHGLQRELLRELTGQKLLLGRLLARQVRGAVVQPSFAAVEFSVFSQFGDDGIIQYLVQTLDIPQRTFIEFGVEDYTESNTRFLLMNDNWSGLVMDGTAANIDRLVKSDLYWKHDLQAKCAFIDRENIDALIAEHGFEGELGLLHIDLDGMDYWVWQRLSVVRPVIVIVEYNSVFGGERAIVVPYDRNFVRTPAHHSNLYWGASLPALCRLAEAQGYVFVGSNSAGNNAYFVRRDRLGPLRALAAAEGYVESRYRESRDRDGRLTFVRGAARLELLRGLPVWDVDADELSTV